MHTKTLRRACFILLASLVGLSACGSDDKKKDDGQVFIIDEIDEGNNNNNDMTPDISNEDMEPDEGTKVNDEPKGLVYLNDPIKDNKMPAEVILPKPDNPEGRLTNGAVNVLNCINEMGEPLSFQGFMVGNLCKEVQTALPAEDGNYLHIKPPMLDSDPNDIFAEVQMYYHVNVIHDYFKNDQNVTGLKQIDALPNVQLYTNELASQFLGRPPGWFPFDNAAYFFPDAFEQIGLPRREEGAIVFGQGMRVDFSYDTSVIYHEYTHSVVGPNRLNGAFPDKYGLNNTPGAINEGLADYFAASILEDPLVGRYGLEGLGQGLGRNMSEKSTCPANLTTAIHDDGRIMASYLWAVRGELGKEVTDQVVLSALNTAIAATGFDQFVQILLMVAEQQSPMAKATFERVAGEYGLLECERAVEWTNWMASRVPISVVGTQQLMGGNFRDGVPGYFQHWVEVPAGKAVRLSWTLQAGGGFPGQGGGGGQLELALSHNKPAELQLAISSASVKADHFVNGIMPQTQGQVTRQTVTIDSSCLSQDGKTYIMFLNKQGGGANITSRSISVVDADGQADLKTCDAAQ